MIKKYIDGKIDIQVSKLFRNLGYARKQQSSSGNTTLAKVTGMEDGEYVCELPDGSTKNIKPSGVRSIGQDGVIFISDDLQLF